ncbi:vacuole membrane protein KMS1-like [Gossypium australe]|uniref:Vacuole membrane protein KMS1-like n=1 Tax=Gossypium australe TaxID=47621 RepID=A0A5B6WHS3_9ROSI|nr:vacuole membrane protein KMS1-like [Gossypium australe]
MLSQASAFPIHIFFRVNLVSWSSSRTMADGLGGWLLLLNTLIATLGILLVTIEGPHEKHVEEVSRYVRFGLWWIVLGVASSIGLGSSYGAVNRKIII